MKKIILGRGEGKTDQLIQLSSELFNYIVCANRVEANRIQERAIQLGLDIPLPITYSDFVERRYNRRGCKGFLIDNVEHFVQSLTIVPVNAITLSV